MSLLTALAISIGGLGGIATWLYLGPLAGALQIWATFIAWGCFYHSGGKESALQSTIICNAAGAIIAGITLLVVSRTGIADTLGLPIWAGICVGVGVACMVLLANIPMFSVIPAQVYGFACVAGYALLASKLGELTAPTLGNPVVVIILSMIAGAVLGYVSEKIAVALTSAAKPATVKA